MQCTRSQPVRLKQVLSVLDVCYNMYKYMLWLKFFHSLNFISLSFLGMVMYDNDIKTRETTNIIMGKSSFTVFSSLMHAS